MSAPKKSRRAEEQSNFEEALLQSILDASEEDLREDLRLAGQDPDRVIAAFDAVVASAAKATAQRRMAQAKADLALFQAEARSKAPSTGREGAREQLERLRRGDAALNEGMMLAARKGMGMSSQDEEGLLDDLADLDRLGKAGQDKEK